MNVLKLINGFNNKKRGWLIIVIGVFIIIKMITGSAFTITDLGLIMLCFFCELMDSSLGMGYGTTLTPLLLAVGYDPLQLVPTILFSEFLSGFASSYFHHDTGNVDFTRRSKDFRTALLLALGSVVGVAIGVNIAVQIPTAILNIAIGIIIFIAGVCIWVLHNHVLVYKTWKMFLLASVASFNKALSGGGYGPLMTSGQILSGVNGKASVGITSFAEGFTCLVGVILFFGKGKGLTLELLLPMVTGALLSVPFSTEFVKRINDTTLMKTIAIVTAALGLFTIYKVLV
ncbi:MAG: sulfite exporter TauE/SafE family protein [Candidatus Marinimicrobia bacterium]|nr:sulfite exporter TauE/SafE family protein [Candidatus Neomarinimicrobiota bacterium]